MLFDGYNFDASGTWSAADRYDNLALPVVNDGWSHDVSLPWSDDCIGRRLTLVNFAWRGLYSSSPYIIDAPDNKFFYENGSAVSQLTINQEAVQLLGFGDDKGFYDKSRATWTAKDVRCSGKDAVCRARDRGQ